MRRRCLCGSYSFLTKSAKLKLKREKEILAYSYSFLTKSAKLKLVPFGGRYHNRYSFLTKSAKLKLTLRFNTISGMVKDSPFCNT